MTIFNAMKSLLVLILMTACFVGAARAETNATAIAKKEILRNYPGARIELDESAIPEDSITARELHPGTLELRAANGTTVKIPFQVFKKAWIALRRIRPTEPLVAQDFQIEEVSLLEPMTREIQGLILSTDVPLDRMEARNTILSGQFPLTSGVQKMPDARRGDVVTIRILSGDLVLTSSGQVQEPKRIGENVRVTTQKTKRELTGILHEGGVVEVTL